MSTLNPNKGGPESNRRRSQRVILTLPVTVRTEDGFRGSSFEEATRTLIVNAHGALIAIAGKVEKGQTLRLNNRATGEEQLCHVVHVGPVSSGKAQVGVEFKTPAPAFWRIAFPPEDWTAPEQEPAARKGKQL
jgi:PilZ domain